MSLQAKGRSIERMTEWRGCQDGKSQEILQRYEFVTAVSRILNGQLIRTAEMEHFYEEKCGQQKNARKRYNSVVECVVQKFDVQECLFIISSDGVGSEK